MTVRHDHHGLRPGRFRGLALVLGAVATGLAHAPALGARSELAAAPVSSAQLLNTLLGLVAVIALIGAIAWVARRGLGLRPQSGGRLRVVGGVALGTRERAVLVQVGARQVLVGVAPGRVQTLYVLEPHETQPEAAAPEPSFAARLAGARAGAAESRRG